MIDVFLFHPLPFAIGAVAALAGIWLAILPRRWRRILRALLILSPGALLFFAAFVLTVARMLVYWLTRKMPNAAAMARAAAELEEIFNFQEAPPQSNVIPLRSRK